MSPPALAIPPRAWPILVAIVVAYVVAAARAQDGVEAPAAAVRVVPLGQEGARVRVWLGDVEEGAEELVGDSPLYRTLPAGTHAVAARWSDAAAEGADDADGAPPERPEAPLGEIELEPGRYYTLLLPREGERDDAPPFALLQDELEALPASAGASLRVVHARPGTPPLRVLLEPTEDAGPAEAPSEATLVAEVSPFEASRPSTLPSGVYRMRVAPADVSVDEVVPLPLTLRAAASHTLFLVPGDGPEGLLWAIDGGAPVPSEAGGSGR